MPRTVLSGSVGSEVPPETGRGRDRDGFRRHGRRLGLEQVSDDAAPRADQRRLYSHAVIPGRASESVSRGIEATTPPSIVTSNEPGFGADTEAVDGDDLIVAQVPRTVEPVPRTPSPTSTSRNPRVASVSASAVPRRALISSQR
jgi:hypothetical protein